MIPPISIDGTDITGATIDGTDVTEITVDGDVVFSVGPDADVIDNFEDSPAGVYAASDTLEDYYDGWNGSSIVSVDSEHFRQTGTVFEGSQALEMAGTSNPFTGIVSHKGDGLNRYPEQGETVEYRVYFENTADKSSQLMYFGVPDGDSPRDNGYLIQLSTGGDPEYLRIGKFSNGSFTELVISNNEPNSDEWLRVECEWGNNDVITMRVENEDGSLVDSISASSSDSNIDATGGIAWSENNSFSSDSTFVDACKIL